MEQAVSVFPPSVPFSSLRFAAIKCIPIQSVMSGRFKPPTEEDMADFTKSVKCKSTIRKTESDVRIFELYLREALDENRQIKDIPETTLEKCLLSYLQGTRKLKPTEGGQEDKYEPSSLNGQFYSIRRHFADLVSTWTHLSLIQFASTSSGKEAASPRLVG